MSDTPEPTTPPEAKSEEQEPAAKPDKPAETGPAEKMKDKWRQGQEPKPVKALEEGDVYGGSIRLSELDDDIEAELAAAMGEVDAEKLLDEQVQPKQSKEEPAEPGPKKGKVFKISGPDVFMDVPGGRTQGVISLDEFPADQPPKIGEEYVITIDGASHGLLQLSLRGAAKHVDWDSVEEGTIVEARVIETNKGGLSVDVNGIRGFMPISQIDLYRVESTEQYVNQRLKCYVTEVKPEEKNLVVSRRALLEKEREEQREKTWATLEVGKTMHGIVRSMKDFGAFVDLGGVDGLLHVSEMSWSRIKHPSELVEMGQRVEVQILKLDHENRKVGLGMKQMLPSPWENIDQRFPPGTKVTGKVTKLMDFGAFVELAPGIEGLVHISELAPQRVFRVSDVVQAGQEVEVMIQSIDKQQERISLSLKALQVEPEPEKTEEEPEEDYTPPPPRRSNKPLRGGVGQAQIVWPSNDEEDKPEE